MRILALDTSTTVSSVAVAEDDQLIAEYTLDARNTHSERLMPQIARIMEESGTNAADIAALAVTIGPGSFTGLRIGLTTAKALAYAWNVPVAGVTTLDSLAAQIVGHDNLVCAILDAQQQRVYAGLFENDIQQQPFQVIPLQNLLEQLKASGKPVIFTGEASNMYAEQIVEYDRFSLARPEWRIARAATAARLGIEMVQRHQTQSALEITPLYIRRSEAEVLWEKRHGRRQNVDHN